MVRVGSRQEEVEEALFRSFALPFDLLSASALCWVFFDVLILKQLVHLRLLPLTPEPRRPSADSGTPLRIELLRKGPEVVRLVVFPVLLSLPLQFGNTVVRAI